MKPGVVHLQIESTLAEETKGVRLDEWVKRFNIQTRHKNPHPFSRHHLSAMLRGNAGQDIFLDAADRSRFCLLLQQDSEQFGVRIHAFCLMSNHLHLALQVGEVPLSRFMQNISFSESALATLVRRMIVPGQSVKFQAIVA
ncbi:transposase IS200 family protein [Geothermobacter ehrlichii]|uniref:Transposase IS200 family protein n=1 Tax=Geothermobacter ehrlichii TaxID=213224 RepID=A0A5D3WQ55_9BACT|nr:transposase [Geothermobacter ehrlichii]TYP00357.1 transposase IS200 family protein [Geothermobacter ehrlichii]